MRKIDAHLITESIKNLVQEANYFLPEDTIEILNAAKEKENWELASSTIDKIIQNANIASKEKVPMCQDTGMLVAFVDIGQDVHIINGNIEDAINEGVKLGYKEGYLRKSVVSDPLYERKNTNDNTPAIIHYNIVPGDEIRIRVAPKGFGSENMSQLKMLKPADGVTGVKNFVLRVVEEAGPNPCPPIVVGVGIGGTFEKAALLAKKALLRDLNKYNNDPLYKKLEKELLEEINNLGIGPQGYGGQTTALKVQIESYPTHIAGLPVAVNIQCHATRHKEIIL